MHENDSAKVESDLPKIRTIEVIEAEASGEREDEDELGRVSPGGPPGTDTG